MKSFILIICLILSISCKDKSSKIDYKNIIGKIDWSNDENLKKAYLVYPIVNEDYTKILINKSSLPIYTDYNFIADSISGNLILVFEGEPIDSGLVSIKKWEKEGIITFDRKLGNNIDVLSDNYVIIQSKDKSKEYVFNKEDYYNKINLKEKEFIDSLLIE